MTFIKGGLISFSFSWWCNRLCSNFRTRQCAFIVTTQPPSPPTSSSRSSSLRKERRHCWCPPGCENLVTASPFHQQDPSALITSASRPLRSYHLILFINTILIYITILIIPILQSICFKTSPRCWEAHRSRLTTLFHPNQPHPIKVSF